VRGETPSPLPLDEDSGAGEGEDSSAGDDDGDGDDGDSDGDHDHADSPPLRTSEHLLANTPGFSRIRISCGDGVSMSISTSTPTGKWTGKKASIRAIVVSSSRSMLRLVGMVGMDGWRFGAGGKAATRRRRGWVWGGGGMVGAWGGEGVSRAGEVSRGSWWCRC
jgi:hypothetical protein